jgi:hypothetical protein
MKSRLRAGGGSLPTRSIYRENQVVTNRSARGEARLKECLANAIGERDLVSILYFLDT